MTMAQSRKSCDFSISADASMGTTPDPLREFLDQQAYNASFFKQLDEREDDDLLPALAERDLAIQLEELDARLCRLARELAAIDRADANCLRGQALAVLSLANPESDDLTNVLARALARTAIAFLDTASKKSE